MRVYNFVRSGQNFTKFFRSSRKNLTRQCRLDFVVIFIGFRDICGQT